MIEYVIYRAPKGFGREHATKVMTWNRNTPITEIEKHSSDEDYEYWIEKQDARFH